jgi:hypothetical protein
MLLGLQTEQKNSRKAQIKLGLKLLNQEQRLTNSEPRSMLVAKGAPWAQRVIRLLCCGPLQGELIDAQQF